jgi:tRNA(Ile)-lysidine synthetase-like protein
MEISGAEAEFVTRAAQEWLGERAKGERRRTNDQVNEIAFDRLPIAVQRRCLQLQLWRQGVVGNFELVEKLRCYAEQPVAVGGTLYRMRRFDYEDEEEGEEQKEEGVVYAVRETRGLVCLRKVERTQFKWGREEVELGRAGEVVMDAVGVLWHIETGKATGPPRKAAGREIFDADRVGSRIVLRHWQPGDRFQPIGMDASVKLQDIFTNECVPRPKRHELLVAATARGEIFWVEGLRISERFKLTKSTIRRLHWRWRRP